MLIPPPVRIARFFLTILLICVVGVCTRGLAATEQPTFGRPKDKKPEIKSKPQPKKEAGPAPEEPDLSPVPMKYPEWEEMDPPRAEPDLNAAPGTVFAWKTSDGLRYTWTLPAAYKKSESYDMVIICHPTGMNFRWGHANHPAGARGFRPDDIVVAVDAPSKEEVPPEKRDRRNWEDTPEVAVRFRDFMLEMSRTFPARRIYLYGHGGGGVFAAYFAGLFPALADGVICHGGGIAEGSAHKGSGPIVFMHGAKDSMVPVSASIEAVKAYEEAGYTGARLRILPAFNDFPNPVRASECLDYLDAMRNDKPEQVLAAIESMLARKRPDEFEYRSPVWYAGAYEALGRLRGAKSEVQIKAVSPEIRSKADALAAKIEAEGTKHVDAVKSAFDSRGAAGLVLDGKPWLGHLVLMREDFRGVKTVEEFCASVGYDAVATEHEKAAGDLRAAWTEETSDESAKQNFEAGAAAIGGCFLARTLPLDFGLKMRFWQKKAADLKLSADSLEKFEMVQNWEKGWEDGQEAYGAIWKKWE